MRCSHGWRTCKLSGVEDSTPHWLSRRKLIKLSNLGFDRHDPSSVHKDNLPVINEKGMCLQYAVTHEKFVWDVRSEPGVVETFEKVYNDKDLIVSFDAVNFGFPKYVFSPPPNIEPELKLILY